MGKSKKVVIDTNVFISAFGWGGKPLAVIELLESAGKDEERYKLGFFVRHSRSLLSGNLVFSETSGFPIKDFGNDKNKKRHL